MKYWKKRVYFSAVSYRHLMYEFQMHVILLYYYMSHYSADFCDILPHFAIKNGTFLGIIRVIAVGQ